MRAYMLGLLGGITVLVIAGIVLLVAARMSGASFARATATPDLGMRLRADLADYARQYPNCRRIVGYTQPGPGQFTGFAIYEDLSVFRARHPAFDDYYTWLLPPVNGAHINLNIYTEAAFEGGCPQNLSDPQYVNQYLATHH